MFKVFLFALIFLLSSCKFLINTIGSDDVEVIGVKSDYFSIIFSGNVNGETHPCGCRHFPLGGLAQVAGQIEKIKNKNEVLIIDAGDTFFSSSTIPKSLSKSLTFTAANLAKGLSKVGLKYHTPGDQDFAAGFEFYKELVTKNKITPLIANLKDPKSINHKKFIIIENGPHKIFLTAIVHPTIMSNKSSQYFNPPVQSLKNLMKEIEDGGFKKDSKFHRIVLISHSGIEIDKNIAKEIPQLDWIIGAHSQSFIRFPVEVGSTKLVQVLSRNHYLGEVKISMRGDKSKDSYEIHEIRDELKDELKPNEFINFIDDHKSQLSKIQEEEQSQMSDFTNEGIQKFATNSSCVDCHLPQVKKWQSTAHSIAYHTLIKSGEQNNLACIKCHSLGTGDSRGFITAKGIVLFDKDIDKEKVEKHRDQYWLEVQKALKPIDSVRSLNPKQLIQYSKKWSKIDDKFKVSNNFSNVQCLNCHDKDPDHPFAIGEKDKFPGGISNIKNKCLSCHDSDQSPEWYKKNEHSIPTEIDDFVLNKMIKRVACPKMPKN